MPSLIEEMDSFHRAEGEMAKMMFLNHRRLHQLEIGDGFFAIHHVEVSANYGM